MAKKPANRTGTPISELAVDQRALHLANSDIDFYERLLPARLWFTDAQWLHIELRLKHGMSPMAVADFLRCDDSAVYKMWRRVKATYEKYQRELRWEHFRLGREALEKNS